jgi:membrane associated rhomboid family serine protease
VTDTPTRLPPNPITNCLILACVGIYAAQWLGGPAFDEMLTQSFGLIPARVSGVWPAWRIGSLAERGLTLFSSIFLHASLGHVLANMLFLWVVGRPSEWVLGSVRLALLFFASGIIGGLTQIWSDPSSSIPVIGASGAISGVFAAYALMFSRSETASITVLGITIPGGLVRVLWIAGAWMLIQGLIGLLFNDGSGGGVAIWAHIGGFIGGIAWLAADRMVNATKS